MVARRLKSGAAAYYWVLPTWAKRSGCMLQVEALGPDYALAKQRCDEVLTRSLMHGENGKASSIPIVHCLVLLTG